MRFSLPSPMAMAPEDTSTISCPAFFRSLMTLHSCSTRRMFICPVACASVDVPTLTTILMCASPISTQPDFTIHIHYSIFSLHYISPVSPATSSAR